MASRSRRLKTEGKCVGCQEKCSLIKGKNHVLQCADALQILNSQANSEEGYLVYVSCAYQPNVYWMLIAVPKSLTLCELDDFLRSIWLECCGHMSQFCIGDRRYSSRYFGDKELDMESDSSSDSKSDDEDDSSKKELTVGNFLDEPSPAFRKKIGGLFSPGLKVRYTYDMGTSTDLILRVLQAIQTCPKQEATLLMRNDPPPFTCEICEKEAEVICSYCQGITCNGCCKRHSCAKEEKGTDMMLPLVNSPRTGFCGYEGED